METQLTQYPDGYRETVITTPPVSAVSWCAVFAGAVGSAALSLILLFLGTGFGLTLVSPWSHEGISATTFSITSILGITIISLLASALGGYLAGRLRTRWVNTARDEVFFRDTAHGFLSWSVATLGTAALLTTVIGTIVGGGIKAGAAVAEGAGKVAVSATTAVAMHNKMGNENSGGEGLENSSMMYLMDSLFRRDDNASLPYNSQSSTPQSDSLQTDVQTSTAATNPTGTETTPTPNGNNTPDSTAMSNAPRENHVMHHRGNIPRGEIIRIFINGVEKGSLPENDLRYAGQVVSRATGVDQQTAEKRVADAFSSLQANLQEAETKAKEAADKARKVSATTSLWFFIALLAGAFIASLMAVYGGRQRDL